MNTKLCLAIFILSVLTTPYFAQRIDRNGMGMVADAVNYDQSVIVDTLYFERELFTVANMHISPYGDPFKTFIIYGSPLPYGTSNNVGDDWSFDYSCNTSSRTYYTIPIFKDYEDYSLTSVMFKVHQYNCYGIYASHTFPICYYPAGVYIVCIKTKGSIKYSKRFCNI